MIRAKRTTEGSLRAIGALTALFMVVPTCWLVRGADPEERRGHIEIASTTNLLGEHGASVGHFEYVGTKRCRMCHSLQYESWLASPKSRSFDALRPGERGEAKLLAGLELHRDYRKDPACLSCHAVGYGLPGGYLIPAEGDGKQRRASRARRGAGCEACHGPGSGFVQIMSDVFKNRRTYDVAELRAAGRHTVTQRTCDSCHNERAICVLYTGDHPGGASHRGRYGVRVDNRAGYHEAFPLKFRRQPGANETDSRDPSESAESKDQPTEKPGN